MRSCGHVMWLGDAWSYHDQPIMSCELEAGHWPATPHQATGMGEGRNHQGKVIAPNFKVLWEEPEG
jgi:hypothetical protein